MAELEHRAGLHGEQRPAAYREIYYFELAQKLNRYGEMVLYITNNITLSLLQK